MSVPVKEAIDSFILDVNEEINWKYLKSGIAIIPFLKENAYWWDITDESNRKRLLCWPNQSGRRTKPALYAGPPSNILSKPAHGLKM